MRQFAVSTVPVLTIFAACSLLAAAEVTPAPLPQLAQVHKVYLLAMGSGLDQYLANQITSRGVLEVVTDPKLADAVFTDSIGSDFEARLKELLPPPPIEPVVPPPDDKLKKDAGKVGEGMELVTAPGLRTSSFSRGRGNLFLVDLKSRSVIWSTHREPKNRTPVELDRNSGRMVQSLAQALGRK